MNFPSIRIEGQIFSGELLQRLDQPDMPGQRPVDYGLPSDVKVKDEIARAWADAQDYWRIFQRKLEAQKLASTATTETRQQWIVPLLGLLGYQLEYQSRGAELNGKIYAISHRAVNRAQIPVHIVGYRDPAGLDRKPENATLRMSPHAMVQEYINLHDQLYGIVTNGATLRLLRDSFRLVRLNYLEFDLDRMFTDGLFADFAVLYRLLHATRLPQSSEATGESIIERYHQDSIEQGTRIRDGLREAVRQALEIFGTGFVANPENHALSDQLASGAVTPTDFFADLLRLIYRLLFLNVVEERNLVFPEGSSAKHVTVYYTHYSVQRLRKLSRAQGVKNERCHDAWLSLLSTFKLFERPEFAKKLGTTAFGGSLFNPKSLGVLPSCQLDNATFFRALDCLCSFNDPATGQRQPVNFGALATEEFGSVYESLLELHPVVESSPVARFGFSQTAGNDRKTSGSYYTPSCLVNCLLDSALDPVLEERVRDYKKLGYATVDEAVLSLKVCDPACGSGHFLIAAAQRIARRLAVIRANGEEPAPGQMRHALREVIGRCIYGVDINPMSVELCRVALWLEAVEPGKPLSFLNRHIQCGNSLLGTTPALLKRGIPDEAFEPIEGDDKKVAAAWKKRNREAKKGQYDLFSDSAAKWSYQNALVAATKDIEAISDDRFPDVERKEAAYADYLASSSFRFGKRLCDAWCAAFVQPKTPAAEPITQQVVAQMRIDPNLCPEPLAAEIDRLADQYNFFHWQIAFPDVFQPREDDAIRMEDVTGWVGGFDCILGNPPWEMMESEDGEFAANEFARHQLFYKSGQYSILNGRRDLYKLFLVNCPALLKANGCFGILAPLGVFIEDDACLWRREFFNKGSVVLLRHFQNHRKSFFQNIHASYRFCAVTYVANSTLRHTLTTVARSPETIPNQYFVTVPRPELSEWLGPDRAATIYPDKEYALLHRAFTGKLREKKKQEFRVVAEFHSSTDKPIVHNERPADGWTLLKNRNIHFFDCNFAPHEAWVRQADVKERAVKKGLSCPDFCTRYPRLVFRDIARNDDERTLIACLAPIGNVSTYDTPMFLPECAPAVYPQTIAFFGALFSSFLFDFGLRPVVDKHIKGYTLDRLWWPDPICLLQQFVGLQWIISRMLELVYVDDAFSTFAEDCGYKGPRYKRDEERRFLLRCELDAALFNVFLGSENAWQQEVSKELHALFPRCRDAISYIMDTFPIVKRKDEAAHGTYRTKDTILSIYDAMQAAIRTGQPYQTLLDPPPGPPIDANGNFIPIAKWDLNNWPKHIHPARNGGVHEV